MNGGKITGVLEILRKRVVLPYIKESAQSLRRGITVDDEGNIVEKYENTIFPLGIKENGSELLRHLIATYEAITCDKMFKIFGKIDELKPIINAFDQIRREVTSAQWLEGCTDGLMELARDPEKATEFYYKNPIIMAIAIKTLSELTNENKNDETAKKLVEVLLLDAI